MITASFAAGNTTYNGKASTTVLTSSLNGVISLDGISLTDNTITSDKDVTNTLTVSLTDKYNLTSIFTKTENITTWNINCHLTAKGKTCNAKPITTVLTCSQNGISRFDDVSLTTIKTTISNKNEANSITVAATGNYSLTSVFTKTDNITTWIITCFFTSSNKERVRPNKGKKWDKG